jgi:hypothetical protein
MKASKVVAKLDAKAVVLGAGLIATGAMVSPAHAFSVNVDEIIYQSASGLSASSLSASINMQLTGSTLRITLTNTSSATSATGAPIILTGLGFSLPSSVNLNCSTSSSMNWDGCKVLMTGSSSVNFSTPSGSDISNEWGWERNPSYGPFRPVPLGEITDGSVNTVVSTLLDATDYQFATGSTFSPWDLAASEGGLLSANYANSAASSLKVIKSTVIIDLALSGTIPLEGSLDTSINAGHVAISFGVPTDSYDPNPPAESIPEPTALGLLGMGAIGAVAVRRRRAVRKV